MLANTAGSRRRYHAAQGLRAKLGAVAILVDDPLWHWRGRRWCHLVSDSDLDELHSFAEDVGLPRRAFQGDHYDVAEESRPLVVQAGAEQVASRELLRRLRDAGLRLTPAQRRAGSGTAGPA